MEIRPKLKLTNLFLLLFCLTALLYPKSSLAKIGTHLGEGDISTQVSIMDMLAANGAERGFPVTLMIDAGTSRADVERLADAVERNGFFPIARVNKVCDMTPQQARDEVNQIIDVFNSNVVVTFGNEVNNPRECSSADSFRQNYRALDPFHQLSPSALDFYNADYPATNFLSQTGMTPDYQNAAVRTANAYGCTDTDLNGCDPMTTDTVTIGTQLTGNGDQIPASKLYLTEFSLSPNGSPAPDEDLDMVRAFIENRGPQTGAIHITPLIRNVCDNLLDEGQWLLYLHGDFYTVHGTKIDPENCEALDEGAVERETKDPDDYYMYSLSLKPTTYWKNPGDPKDMYIYNLVVDQNYQVYKPSPKLSITTFTKGNWEAFFEWMQRNGIEYHIFGGDADYWANLEEGRIPLFRGMEAVPTTEKISSFEGYFGSNHPNRGEIVTTGVAENLLSQQQKCEIKVRNLEDIREMCLEKEVDGTLEKTLVNPEKCAFHKKIPDSKYYLFSTERGANAGHEDLLDEIYALEEEEITCQELSQPFRKKFDVDREWFESVQFAISQMSLNLDYAYRWAFLIIAPKQNTDRNRDIPLACMPSAAGNDFDTDPFCFLYIHKGGGGTMKNAPLHAPIFVAFKIPVFGTNTVESYEFRDAGLLSADVLLDAEQRKYVEKKIALREKVDPDDPDEEPQTTRVQALLNGIQRARDIPTVEEKSLILPIFCEGMPMCTCAHNTCPLRMALVDIVNGSFFSPYGFRDEPDPHVIAEDAGDIYTPAKAERSSSRTFHDLFSNEEAYDIANKGSHTYKWGVVVKSDKSEGNYNDEHPVEVGVYVVAPLNNKNSTLDYMSEALKTFWTQDQLETIIENNCVADTEGKCGELPLFYPLKDAEFGFKTSDTHRFHNPDKIDQCPCAREVNGVCVERTRCKNDYAEIELDDQNVGLFFPGAKFGWYVRKLQETLHIFGGKAHNYILSCKRTEDLFLGRCSGKVYGAPYGLPYNGSPTPAGSCEPITDDSNPCSINNLKEVIANWPGNESLSDDEVTRRATIGSTICNAESGGNVTALNDGCVSGESVDYSVGLFQINLLAHACSEYFDYSWTPPSCTILVDQSRVDQCVDNVMDRPNDGDKNIEYAMQISDGGADWSAWSTKDYCGL